MALYFLQFL